MQIAQRSIMVIGMCIMLSLFAAMLVYEKEPLIINDWETVQAARFMNGLCQTGRCTYEGYILFFEALNCCGNRVEIRIEEYRPEQDLSKRRYYSLIPWEDMKDCLYGEGQYVFSKNSIVILEVMQSGRTMKRKNRRIGFVIGEGGNDT